MIPPKNCTICHYNMHDIPKHDCERKVTLPCGHTYHQECISEWNRHIDKCVDCYRGRIKKNREASEFLSLKTRIMLDIKSNRNYGRDEAHFIHLYSGEGEKKLIRTLDKETWESVFGSKSEENTKTVDRDIGEESSDGSYDYYWKP